MDLVNKTPNYSQYDPGYPNFPDVYIFLSDSDSSWYKLWVTQTNLVSYKLFE